MSKKDLLVNFVIDKSGSMNWMTQGTIEGFNAFIAKELEQAKAKTYVTETLFDTHFHVKYVAKNANKIAPLGSWENPYRPGGGTALYDAVAVSIRGVEGWLENHRDFNGKVLTVIWTDGGENSSREFTRYNGGIGKLNSIIEQKQTQGWAFQFMGTGAGFLAADDFVAIPWEHRVHVAADDFGQTASYTSMNLATSNLRSAGTWKYTQDTYASVDTRS